MRKQKLGKLEKFDPNNKDHLDSTKYKIVEYEMTGRRPSSVEIVSDVKDDVFRRDITINSFLLDKDGNVIDYFDGKKDIKNKVIKTVGIPTERFSEDKLRLLRVVRFAAKLGFKIETQTKKAIQDMSGEITKIAAERIRDEFIKAAGYGGKKFSKFIQILDDVNMLDKILPDFYKLKGMPHKESNHPEGCPYIHTLTALEYTNSKDPIVNLAILFHDVGKSVTLGFKNMDPNWPTYYQHETKGVKIFEKIAKTLKLDNKQRDIISFVIANHMRFHLIPEMKKGKVASLLKEPHFDILKTVCKSDWFSRGSEFKKKEYDEIEAVLKDVEKNIDKILKQPTKLVDGNDVMMWTGLKSGPELGKIINDASEWVLEQTAQGKTVSNDDIKAFVLKIFKK